MERLKKTKIRHINIDANHRLIFMSDIHSDYLLFDQILKNIKFSKYDYLFVIGDLYEKGPFGTNLKALEYFKELSNKDNVYLLAGNCDEVLRFILPPVDKTNFFRYVFEKPYDSIIDDMAYNMNYKLSYDMDVDDFCKKAYNKYKYLYDFIDTLDDVIFINDKIVLVHGGIFDLDNIPDIALNVLKVDSFYTKIDKSPLIQIVGHYPTRNYRDDVTIVNPIINLEKNIISIDGGNQVADGGQINVLFLNDISTNDFYFKSFNHYPKYIFKDTINYPMPDEPYSIYYGMNEIEVISGIEDFYLARVKNSNAVIYVLKNNVYYKDDKLYCYDGSNIFVSFRKGDKVSVIEKKNPYSLVNYDGVIGLVDTKYLE